jgi:hypothetical protein
MTELHPYSNSIKTFYTPFTHLEVALHRRGNEWLIVHPRGYGMAEGQKLFGKISCDDEHSNSATHDPPASKPNLNPRFWMVNDSALGVHEGHMFKAEPEVLKDSGITRTRTFEIKNVFGKVVGEEVKEEKLVEVLVKEEELCHRCASCGQWEYSYADSPRHKKIGEDKDGRPVYWCGVSLLACRAARAYGDIGR